MLRTHECKGVERLVSLKSLDMCSLGLILIPEMKQMKPL